MRQVKVFAERVLAVADNHEVDEIGQRLRVEVGDGAADEDQRVALVTLGGQQRNAEHGQQVQQMQVVVLVRHGKADQVKIPDGPLGFHGKQGGVGIAVVADVGGVGQEHALAQGVGTLVDQPVDRLQAQVRHADVVGLRIRQREAQAHGARFLHDRAALGQQALAHRLPRVAAHASTRLRATSPRSRAA